MRYLNCLAIIVLISCIGKPNETELGYFSNFQFSLDTVIIDSNPEIIFLKYQLFGSDKSNDDRYLLNFNMNDHTVEKINLDELRQEEKLPFEKEGPNGTGPFIGRINAINENQIMLNGMNQSALFSLDGKRLRKFNFENFSLGGHPMEGGEELKSSGVFDPESNRIYGLIFRHMDKSYVLGILHLDAYEISKVELKTFVRMADFTFNYNVSGSILIKSPEGEIEKHGSKVILSNQVTSSLMWYDTELDSLFIKSYKNKLTANEKVKDYKLDHNAKESFEAEYMRFHSEINFLPPFWDQKNQIFYRFSFEENEDKTKVYLTAYDMELNQIGESRVPQLIKKPAKHFAKDGNIWIYENTNDEMGFVRLKMENIN
ncbi:DUF4221 family protein [Negadavirga shengliensis]|uniref:DUF4221 family protein n=1 Tax=Negadavirga shengliensis TaxID=1389218 RepID=A0ABV9T402_9BACT